MRTKIGQLVDILCTAVRYESGCLAQCEGPPQPLGCEIQGFGAMRHRHGEYEIGLCDESGVELACGETGCVTAQLLQDVGGVGLNGVPDHGARACAGRAE